MPSNRPRAERLVAIICERADAQRWHKGAGDAITFGAGAWRAAANFGLLFDRGDWWPSRPTISSRTKATGTSFAWANCKAYVIAATTQPRRSHRRAATTLHSASMACRSIRGIRYIKEVAKLLRSVQGALNDAVATRREGRRSPRSGQAAQHRRWGRARPIPESRHLRT